MVSLEDIHALLKGPFRVVVQFGGLPCAGTLALLSRDANSSMKENLTSLLSTLRETEIDIDKPLLSAARYGFDAVVSALVGAGADKNAAKQDGVTPLLVAARNGHEAVVSALLTFSGITAPAESNG